MSLPDIVNIVAGVLVSLGGGAAIIWKFSSYLGGIWANRLMEADRAKHAEELEKLRLRLQHENEKSLSNIRSDLEIYKEKHLKSHADKIAIYRLATDIISEMLATFDLIKTTSSPPPDMLQRRHNFNRERIRAYGYLAMLAPQNVMDAFDALFDHLLMVIHGNAPYEWSKVRDLAIKLINEVRKDISENALPIEYKGKL